MKRKSLKGAWAFALALLLICSLPFTAFASEETTETAFAPPLNENIGDTLISHIKNFGNAFKSQFSEFSYDILDIYGRSKNLLSYPYSSSSSFTRNGISFFYDDDAIVFLNGISTSPSYFIICDLLYFPEGVYTFSGVPDGSSLSSYYCTITYNSDGITTLISRVYDQSFTFEVPDGGLYLSISINVASGVICDNIAFYPQLELGDKATSFEPYHNCKYIPTPSFICLVTFVCIGLVLSILIIVLNYIFGGNKKI